MKGDFPLVVKVWVVWAFAFHPASKHCAVSASKHKNKPHLLALRFEVKADVHLPFSLIEIDQTECLLMNLGWLTF